MGAVQGQAARTAESLRAEVAFRDWSTAPPGDRPLRAHRPVIAKALFEVLKAHEVSKTRFACMLGIDKKQVKKMLACDAPIPFDVAFAMPIEMALDLFARIRSARGVRSDLVGEIARLDRKGLVDVINKTTARLAEEK